ncbi:MAG TPA: cytochrome c3 family protein [Calditrichia bacterium]|nr:hypothetical protein [Calditrichota bacterium]HQU70925.1 cytochrome c3 family protein [Calditrichia bacterium]HQV33303.1 cytochrome c3 family protein [Calditrichia bacterium]
MKTFLLQILAVVLLGAMMVSFPEVLVTPGPLSAGHQDLDRDCLTCHSPFRGTPSANCRSCHQPEEIGLKRVSGEPFPADGLAKPVFHQKLGEADCQACHTDHAGRSPERAGTGFTHDLLDASLAQNCMTCHREQQPSDRIHSGAVQACAKCHQTDAWQNARFDHKTALAGNPADCLSCHEGDRPVNTLHRDLKMSCGKCHGTEAWRPANYDHDRYFRFDRHHPPDCLSCHNNSGDYSQYTCYNCHEHTPRKIAAEHREEGIFQFENCVECHRSGNEHEILRKGMSGRRKSGHDD